jgi:RHS repeat-associated protein
VGALLQISDHATSKTYLPAYDGNGNVVALFDGAASGGSAGSCVAAYEYNPYGEFLRCEGSYARTNPFRFSTKFTDDDTGLVYYGRRYYSPSQGRFLGRDPKMEKGGLNLYGFVTNNPINSWDYLGMEPDYHPTTPGETATVLEEVEPGQWRYIQYRAVRLADLNNQENGSSDDDLIWVVDNSGNRDGPTRGMPEPGGAGSGNGSSGTGSFTINVNWNIGPTNPPILLAGPPTTASTPFPNAPTATGLFFANHVVQLGARTPFSHALLVIAIDNTSKYWNTGAFAAPRHEENGIQWITIGAGPDTKVDRRQGTNGFGTGGMMWAAKNRPTDVTLPRQNQQAISLPSQYASLDDATAVQLRR